MIYIIICILLFIFLLLTISYFDNRQVLESFYNLSDTTGFQPGGGLNSSWTAGLDRGYLKDINRICQIGGSCNTEDGWGYYNSDCVCVNNNYSKSSSSSKPSISLEEEWKYPPEEEYTSLNSSYGRQDEDGIIDQNCIPNTTNFADHCKSINSKLGVKRIIPCNSTTSKIDCANNYIGGVYHGTNISGEPLITTPCIDKSSDFNTLCKYYNSSKIPEGYNVNSIGVKYILPGAMGDCYMPNGLEDAAKARAVCSYNYNEQISKIPPSKVTSMGDGTTILMDYNVFTGCHPTSTNFTNKCNKLLKKHKSYASEISSYDCNPGYVRARCIKNSDRYQIKKNIFIDNVLHQKHNYNEDGKGGGGGSIIGKQCPDKCPTTLAEMADDIADDLTSDIKSAFGSNPINAGVNNFINTIGDSTNKALNTPSNNLNNGLSNVFVQNNSYNKSELGSALQAMFTGKF